MASDKSFQQNELYKTIWKIANELRGSVDGWDFKQYVLGMIFYRYISQNLTNYINENEKQFDKNFDYATLDDEKAKNIKEVIIEEKGFFILPSELFCNVVKNASRNENLNVDLKNIFKSIEASSQGAKSQENIQGLFADLDPESTKLGNDILDRNKKLAKLLNAVDMMALGEHSDHNIDVFGDAYEYLMAMYASQAGKSGGEFFTPQEVSELLARIVIYNQKEVNKVYDPCCGSGSLLLKFAKILGKENVKNGFYGQEINLTTYNLCRINMFLHDISHTKFHISHGDTLLKPYHKDDEPFDAIVSNPPYSTKWEGKDNPLLINDPRFSPAGVLAPKNKADLAFSMHMLSWLSNQGACAIVQFPGVLYRGGAEQKIREYLVNNNFVDSLIQLPSNLFFGTSIATCILVLKKNKLDNKTLFIDASNEYIKENIKNTLTKENINNILEVYGTREEIKHFSSLASIEDIVKNDYNLSINRYVQKEDTQENIDIKTLNKQIQEIVLRQDKLRKSLDDIISELEY